MLWFGGQPPPRGGGPEAGGGPNPNESAAAAGPHGPHHGPPLPVRNGVRAQPLDHIPEHRLRERSLRTPQQRPHLHPGHGTPPLVPGNHQERPRVGEDEVEGAVPGAVGKIEGPRSEVRVEDESLSPDVPRPGQAPPAVPVGAGLAQAETPGPVHALDEPGAGIPPAPPRPRHGRAPRVGDPPLVAQTRGGVPRDGDHEIPLLKPRRGIDPRPGEGGGDDRALDGGHPARRRPLPGDRGEEEAAPGVHRRLPEPGGAPGVAAPLLHADAPPREGLLGSREEDAAGEVEAAGDAEVDGRRRALLDGHRFLLPGTVPGGRDEDPPGALRQIPDGEGTVEPRHPGGGRGVLRLRLAGEDLDGGPRDGRIAALLEDPPGENAGLPQRHGDLRSRPRRDARRPARR